jgi:hypothetical protein
VENPHRRLWLDLTHESVGPVYGTRGGDHPAADPEREFARGHYEQHMRVRGRLAVDGVETPVDGFGLRDHSWGPRSWQALSYYRWLNCTFGPDFGIMVSEICPQEGALLKNGVVVRGGRLQQIRAFDLESTLTPGTRYHQGLATALELDDGTRLALEGRVTSFIPLRHRRAGHVTQIGEGRTEYRCDGHVGVGISEYLDQLV